MRTYGTYTHKPADGAGRSSWLLDASPATAIKLKRLFPRVMQERSGTIVIADSPDVARELEWFMSRYPFDADPHSAGLLRKRAQGHRDVEDLTDRILAGYRPQYGWQEPAIAPRNYQEVVPHLVTASGRLLVGDDLGMGKSFASLLLLCDPQALPALVVTMTHLPFQWLTEIRKFLPWLDAHIITSGKVYDLGVPGSVQGELPLGLGAQKTRRGCTRVPDVLITSYSKLAGWVDYLPGFIRTVIFDEIQELRTGPGTAKYTAAGRVADNAKYKIGLSATPIYNYGDEAHNVISILDPDALGSAHEFRREWTDGGQKARVKDPAALGHYLRDQGLLLRRTRADVGRELPQQPQRIEQAVDTNTAELTRLAGDAAAMARLVLDQAADRTERWRAAGEFDLRLRQATGIAKAPYVAEFVHLLLQSEQKVLLFGWHHDVYSIWEHHLRAHNPVRYTGSESPAVKHSNAQRFTSDPECRVMLMSLRAGAGIDGLQHSCNVAVFGELDWSPKVMDQNIGRLARDGQERGVLAYFMVCDEGSDPPMAEVLELKRQQSDPIMDPAADLFEAMPETDVNRVKLMAANYLRQRGENPQLLASIDANG